MTYTRKNLRGKTLEKYKETLELTNVQKEVLIGTLLGNASFSLRKNKPFYSVKFEQGIKQEAYINHLYEIFEPYVGSPPVKRIINKKDFIEKGSSPREAIWFRTYSHDSLIFYYNLFYKEKKQSNSNFVTSKIKIVPRNIHKFLTPRALAYWFMDNGTKGNNFYLLHTQGFSKEDSTFLCNVLKQLYQLECSLNQDHGSLRIKISSKSTEEFRNLISAYLIPNFYYKL